MMSEWGVCGLCGSPFDYVDGLPDRCMNPECTSNTAEEEADRDVLFAIALGFLEVAPPETPEEQR